LKINEYQLFAVNSKRSASGTSTQSQLRDKLSRTASTVFFVADIALQHKMGNRWQWHRQKSNGSATVRTEKGEAQRPL
jgi:hypothetical protein